MPAKITVEQTTDENYIKSVFLNPAIYASIADDSRPDPSALDIGAAMRIPGFFLRVIMDGVDAGAAWLIWKDSSTVEAHTALLPNCRGSSAIAAIRLAIEWVFVNTRATDIVSYAWSDSPAVAWFCKKVGMTERNTDNWPNTRNGHPVSITYFGIKKEPKCQPQL